MKKLFLLSTLIAVLIPAASFAKGAHQFLKAVHELYPNAEKTRAFQTAAEPLDPDKINGYAVLNEGGIPAERAEFFISWGEYDYRGTNIDMEDGKVTTRRGKVYAYLKKGDILAIVNVTALGRKLYFKLITSEVYIPPNRTKEKRHSRLTLMMIFKVPKDVRDKEDTQAVLSGLRDWLVPFKSLEDAKKYAKTIAPTPKETKVEEKDKKK